MTTKNYATKNNLKPWRCWTQWTRRKHKIIMNNYRWFDCYESDYHLKTFASCSQALFQNVAQCLSCTPSTEILIFHFCHPSECKDTSPRTNHQTALTTTVEWGSCDESSSSTECCDKVAHACVTNAMFRYEICTCSRDSRIVLLSRCFSLRHSSGRGDCGLLFKTNSGKIPAKFGQHLAKFWQF